MAVTNVLQTYGDATIKTDIVQNAVEIISAREDGIFSLLGKTNAIAMIHSYSVDTLQTPGSIATEQGTDFPFGARTTPTLLTNLVQEFSIPIRVTRPQMAVSHYHGQNELDRQLAKGMIEFTNGLEYDLVRSTQVSGVSGTAQKMNGIIAAVSTSSNYTSHTSGTIFSATILDGLMENNWATSNGDVATDLYVGGVMRRVLDGFVPKTNNIYQQPDVRGIVKTVRTYETSFGAISLHTHRYLQVSGDATGRVLAINPEKLKVAFLDAPTILTDLQKGGAYEPRAFYASATLEVHNQQSNWFADGFLLSA